MNTVSASGNRIIRLTGLLWLCILSLVGGACNDPVPSVELETGVYLNHSPGAQYVGKEQCATCHTDVYETFIESQMGRSFRAGLLSNSDANFDNPPPIYDREGDMYYQPFHRGDEIFVREYRLVGRDTVYQRVEQIDYIVGSGHHTNSHMREENGYIYQVPVTWYVQEGHWSLAPKFGGGNVNPRFDRAIPDQCMNCHNARPTFVAESENRYERIPFGIDCEQCHGPGSIHIEQKLAGIVVDTSKAIDYSIVHPGKLPVDRQMDICSNCHMQGASVFREGKTALDFRPGMDLTDVQNVFWPRYEDSTSVFIMASHPDRLKMSACFKASHKPGSAYKPVTCITCHDPHLSISAQAQTRRMIEGCTSCHAGSTDVQCSEPEASRLAMDNDCAGCHMPTSGSSDIPHVRITDHYIRVVPADKRAVGEPDRTRSQRSFVRVASLLRASVTLPERADGYLAVYETVTNDPRFLDSTAVFLERARASVPEERMARSLIHLWFWQKEYQKIADLLDRIPNFSSQDAWTHYRIGEAFLGLGRLDEAITSLNTAVSIGPSHLRFRSKLAQAYSAAGRIEETIRLYDGLIADNGTVSEYWNNRGFARIRTGDLERAESDLRKSISLDPDSRETLGNLASLLYNTGRAGEARPLARRLLTMDPGNEQYQILWNAING